jgi:hypothetical protein
MTSLFATIPREASDLPAYVFEPMSGDAMTRIRELYLPQSPFHGIDGDCASGWFSIVDFRWLLPLLRVRGHPISRRVEGSVSPGGRVVEKAVIRASFIVNPDNLTLVVDPHIGEAGVVDDQASLGPWRSISGSTNSRTLAKTFSSDQLPSPTKCNSD